MLQKSHLCREEFVTSLKQFMLKGRNLPRFASPTGKDYVGLDRFAVEKIGLADELDIY